MTLVLATQKLEIGLASAEKKLESLSREAAKNRELAASAEVDRLQAVKDDDDANKACNVLKRKLKSVEDRLKAVDERLQVERKAFEYLEAEKERVLSNALAQRQHMLDKFDNLEDFFIRRSKIVSADAYRQGYFMAFRPESERVTPGQIDVDHNLEPGVYPEEKWVDSDAELGGEDEEEKEEEEEEEEEEEDRGEKEDTVEAAGAGAVHARTGGFAQPIDTQTEVDSVTGEPLQPLGTIGDAARDLPRIENTETEVQT